MADPVYTDLEKRCIRALRLSTEAATYLLDEIQDNIKAAEAELIRSGVPDDVVNAEGDLVSQAVVTYVLMMMNDEDKYAQYFASFTYQQDNLRKTNYEE